MAFFQRAAALSSSKPEHGSFFASRNCSAPELSRLYGLLQHRQPPPQTFDFRNTRNHEWASSQREAAAVISRKDVTPPSTTAPQTTHPLAVAAASAALRSERRWWPFTFTDVGAAAAAAATGERRVETGTAASFANSIGSSSSRAHQWAIMAMSPAAVSGDRRLPFGWRPGGGSGRDVVVGFPSNNTKITTMSSDPVVIDEALDAQQLERQKHVQPRDSAMSAYEACRKKRPSTLEVQVQDETAADDLELSLSPAMAIEAKRRKTTAAASEQETMDASGVSILLSLSPPAAASMQKQQQEKTTTRRSDEAVLGQSTLDLTMSIRALE